MAWHGGGPWSGGGPPWASGSGGPPWNGGGWWGTDSNGNPVQTQTVVATQTVTEGGGATTKTQVITAANTSPSPKASLTSDPSPSSTRTPSPSPNTSNTSTLSHTNPAASGITQSDHIQTSLTSSHSSPASNPTLFRSHTYGSSIVSGVAAAASTSNTTSASGNAQFTSSSHSHHDGALIGGILGGVALFFLLGFLTVLSLRRRARNRTNAAQQITTQWRGDASGFATLGSIPEHGSIIPISVGHNNHPGLGLASEAQRMSVGEISPPHVNDGDLEIGYGGYLGRLPSKVVRERARLNNNAAVARSNSQSSSSHGHSVHSSNALLAGPIVPGSSPVNVFSGEDELTMLRAEIGRLRALEAVRSWDNREGDSDVLPAYESGPARARPAHPPPSGKT